MLVDQIWFKLTDKIRSWVHAFRLKIIKWVDDLGEVGLGEVGRGLGYHKRHGPSELRRDHGVREEV